MEFIGQLLSIILGISIFISIYFAINKNGKWKISLMIGFLSFVAIIMALTVSLFIISIALVLIIWWIFNRKKIKGLAFSRIIVSKPITIEDRIRNLPDFTVADLYFTDSLNCYLGYDEVRKKICIVDDMESQFNPYIYSVKDLIEIEIIEDKISITKTSRTSQVGGAITGEILPGDVRALIEEASGKRKAEHKTNKFVLHLIVNDLRKPSHNIEFLLQEDIEHWYAILRILMKQSEVSANFSGN
jgi:hypothetical protein